MCRTIHAILSTVICGVQMVVRVVMTTLLMVENVFRMVLQTLYNFLSFMLQLVSLVPLCCVFLISSRMKCFMCGGGGPCPISRGGACDCLMSLFAIIVLFFIFRATGVLDKIFFSIGYAKATTYIVRFVPTTGSITECSRNDTDTEYVFYPLDTTAPILQYFYVDPSTTEEPKPRLRIGEGNEQEVKDIIIGKHKLRMRLGKKENDKVNNNFHDSINRLHPRIEYKEYEQGKKRINSLKENDYDDVKEITMILYEEKPTTDLIKNGTNALYYLMTFYE